MTPATSNTLPTYFGINRREALCFIVAAAVHSLLFLWKGGMLNLPDAAGNGLGETLVGVDFLAEIPNYDAGGGGAPQAKPQGLIARMKSIMSSKPAAGSPNAKTLPAKGDHTGFEGLVNKKQDDMVIAKGQTENVVVQPSIGKFDKAKPNLKENSYKVAKSDTAFPIIQSSNREALVNVNAVSVGVADKTSPSMKSFSGGPGTGPALQSKEFAPSGTKSSGSFGSPSGSDSGSGAGKGALAMGGSGLASGGPATGLGGSGTGTGYGSGSGSGGGSGSGSGYGAGTGSGRAYGSGSGTGFGVGGDSQLKTLHRNQAEPAGMSKAARDTGYSITGPLAHRPVLTKELPPYSQDARVALRFRVDWSGRVLDGILVEISSGNPSFDAKVMAALKNWLFQKLPADRSNEIQEGVISFRFKGV